MYQLTLLFLGTMAFILTAGTITMGSVLAVRGRGSEVVDIGGGFMSLILWLVFAYGSMNVQIVTQSGDVVGQSHPALAVIALIFAAITGAWGLIGSVDIVNVFSSGTY